jgi:hypothetical protein
MRGRHLIFTGPWVNATSEAYLRTAQRLEGFPAGLVGLIEEPCEIEQSSFSYPLLVNQQRSCSRREICAVVTLVSTIMCSPQRGTNTRHAFIQIVVDLRAEKSENLPALSLKLVRLARIVDALAQC